MEVRTPPFGLSHTLGSALQRSEGGQDNQGRTGCADIYNRWSPIERCRSQLLPARVADCHRRRAFILVNLLTWVGKFQHATPVARLGSRIDI